MSFAFPRDDDTVGRLLRLSLEEDLGDGDVTTLATVPAGLDARATISTREDCVVAGLEVFAPLAAAMLARARPEEEAASLAMTSSLGDGARARAGAELCGLAGTARALLAIERTFLNYLARLSGIATLTARYVEAVRAAGSGTRVLDTRKTTPGHRLLEKYAVRCGGGANHRVGLFDAVLIKDNHVAAAGGIAEAVARALAGAPKGLGVEVECDDEGQVEEALGLGARAILLDNFSPQKVAEVVARVAGAARVEVSGGVTLESIGQYAAAGPDDISVGRLTHSPRSVDLTMDMVVAA